MRIENPFPFLAVLLFLLSLQFCSAKQAHAEEVPYEVVHAVIVKFPVAHQDRDNSYKQEQLKTVAQAISDAGQAVRWKDNDRVSLVAYLLTIGYHESRYRIKIHEGVKHAYSYGLFQVVPQSHGVKRSDLVGLTYKETFTSAFISGSVIAKSFQCGSQPADIFTSYYGGVPCKTKWKTLDSRVSTYYWARAKLVKELTK